MSVTSLWMFLRSDSAAYRDISSEKCCILWYVLSGRNQLMIQRNMLPAICQSEVCLCTSSSHDVWGHFTKDSCEFCDICIGGCVSLWAVILAVASLDPSTLYTALLGLWFFFFWWKYLLRKISNRWSRVVIFLQIVWTVT